MIREDIRLQLPKDAMLFDNPAYDNSIIGVSTNGNIIYNLENMVNELSVDENIFKSQAHEWIEYNTIRALPYMGENAPIIYEELII